LCHRWRRRRANTARCYFPIALVSFAAAGLARSDPRKTSWVALEMGLATFIVPFMFFYSPVLLWQGPWYEILQATVTGCIGCGSSRLPPKAGSAAG